MYHNKKGGILIVTEQDGTRLHRISFELLGIAKNLASKVPAEIHSLVIGSPGIDVSELSARGSDTIFYISDPSFKVPEETLYKENIVPFVQELEPEIILFGATNFGRSLAPRVAASLKAGLTADCTDFDISEDGRLIQVRPAFSDNIFAHIHTVSAPQIATVRYKEFAEAPAESGKNALLVHIPAFCTVIPAIRGIMESATKMESISDAQVIIAAGRGIKNREDLRLIRELADLLGGRVGVSRALVDAGIAGSEIQIGYSGHRVKPKLYVAIGISGAPQHLAGMKESGAIIAINTDPSAPIFQIADIGYIGNLYEVVPAMITAIRERSGK